MDKNEPNWTKINQSGPKWTTTDLIGPNRPKLTKMDEMDRNAMLMLLNRRISTINAIL